MNCSCSVYPFPHRPGGGKCESDPKAEFLCTDCKGLCNVVSCDNGIGSYEFWGRIGWDSQPYMGSSCCEAPVTDLLGRPPVFEEPEQPILERN